jgi:hypothetical protein
MSAIASFHLFNKSALEALVAKTPATPPKTSFLKSLFGSKEPPYQQLFVQQLEAIGEEVAVFEYSGHAFSTLELFLEEHSGIEVNAHIEATLTQQLEERIGPCQAFDSSGANELLGRLSAITITRPDLQAFADDEYGEDQGVMVEAVESAFTSLKSWLSKIQAGQIGIIKNG